MLDPEKTVHMQRNLRIDEAIEEKIFQTVSEYQSPILKLAVDLQVLQFLLPIQKMTQCYNTVKYFHVHLLIY